MYAGDPGSLTYSEEPWDNRFRPTGESERRWTTDWSKSVQLAVSNLVPEWPKWAWDVGLEFAPSFGQDYYRYETGYTLMQVRRDGNYFVDAKAMRDVWSGQYVWRADPKVVYQRTDWRTYVGDMKSEGE
jgi:hypothetical protein